MQPGELRSFFQGVYWISVLPARIALFFVTSIGMVLLLPVQLISWLLSGDSFFRTMPYVLLLALTVDDPDFVGPVPYELNPLVQELGLINGWYLDHIKFVRIFLLLRHYQRDPTGEVTVHAHLAPRRKLLRLSLGVSYLCLWGSPSLLLL